MLYKPLQPPISPRNPQQNFIHKTQSPIPNRIIVGNSPPVKVMAQPHRVNVSPSQQYMMHLVPQHPRPHPQPTINLSSNIVRPESSSLINKFSEKKSQPLTQSILSVERPPTIINTHNLASTGFRSRGLSQLSNKQSRLTTQRNQYLIPQSPTNLRRMQPVRRVSQHRLNISSADKQGQEQNIKIVIQTNSSTNQISTPSKITIQHLQGAANNQIVAKNGSFVMSTHPQVVQSIPIQIVQNPKIVHVVQHKLERDNKIVNNFTLNQSKESKVVQQQQNQEKHQSRAYSYSMNNKQVSRQNKKVSQKQEMRSNFKDKEQMEPDIIILDPPSDLFENKKLNQQNQQLTESKSTKKSQIQNKGAERRYQQQKTSRFQKNKLSLQSSKLNKQDRKKVKKEVYNQYYEQSDYQSHKSVKESQRRHYLIYQEQNSLFTSTLLLNEIYENQVNKALLKMNVVQNKSREKSLKRKDF